TLTNELADVEVPPAHFVGPRAATNAVHLEPDEAGRGHRVFQIGDGNIVHPRADRAPIANDAIAVPLAALERAARLGIRSRLLRAEPAAVRLVIDEAGRTVGLDLDLIAVDAAVVMVGKAIRSDLHAGV